MIGNSVAWYWYEGICFSHDW